MRMIKHILMASLIGVTATGGWVSDTASAHTCRDRPACAAPTFEFDEATFLAEHRIVTIEEFDGDRTFPPAKKTVVFDKLLYTSLDTADPYWVLSGSPGQPPERLFREFRDGPDEDVDLLIRPPRGTAVKAIGFEIGPSGTPNRFAITVVTRDGRRTTKLLPADTDGLYVGISHPRGITRVIISQRPDLADGVTVNFTLDDVARTRLIPLG